MIKLKAFLVHLSMSALVVLIFFSLIFFIWYPSPYLALDGGNTVITMLVGVDLILGPLLTFIVYKPGKKGLYFDLSLIIVVQIMAFSYGAYTLFSERPQYIAYVAGQFKLVPASVIDTSELYDSSLYNGPLSKPKLVYVELPTDDVEKINEIMFSALGGKDAEFYAELYRNYNDSSALITAKNKNQLLLERILERHPPFDGELKLIERDYNITREQLIFYPINGKEKSYIVVLKKQGAEIVALLDYSPWGLNR